MSTAALLGGFAAGPVATALAETGRTSTAEAWLFWTVGPVMVLAALGLLFARRTIYAAMSVVLVMICLAILYVAQEAPFLGVVQVVVYTGAVMMLFLFVLMLVGVDASDSLTETIRGQRWIAVLLGIGLGITLVSVTLTATGFRPVGLAEANADSNPVAISRIIFGDFVFNLQAVGILLITAALGALVLTHKERLTRKVGQRERQEGRVAAGGVLTPLPSPVQRDGRPGPRPGRPTAGPLGAPGAARARPGASGRGGPPGPRCRRRHRSRAGRRRGSGRGRGLRVHPAPAVHHR
jgi:NADH-quinone oxidoreductase subunit J